MKKLVNKTKENTKDGLQTDTTAWNARPKNALSQIVVYYKFAQDSSFGNLITEYVQRLHVDGSSAHLQNAHL